LLSLAAVAAGAPSAAELFGPKPVRDLGYEEIIELIIKSDHVKDWEGIQCPDREVTFYKHDPNLRFEFLHTDEGIQCRDFREPWANKFSHCSATGYFHDLYYGNTLLGRFILVAVDGARALLPLPRNNDNLTVSKINYAVAKIHDVLGTLDQYMNMAGMRVEQFNRFSHKS
jgi:hypothetical protein